MKRITTSFLVLAMTAIASLAKADNITLEQAKDAAAHYMSHHSLNENINAKDLMLTHQVDNEELGIPAAYFFNVNGGGWLIMAGTTVVHPIIAFSAKGELDMDNAPDNMRWYLNGYIGEVKDAQRIDAEEDLPDSPEWVLLANHALKGNAKDGNEVVLSQAEWDQGSPYPTSARRSFNKFCPQYNGYYTYVGCAATALAQLCYYYRYPVHGADQVKTYTATSIGNRTLSLNFDTVFLDYNNMRNVITSRLSQTYIDAIAWVSYVCGIASSMQYGVDGSSTTAEDVNEGAAAYLKYQSGSVVYRSRVRTPRYVTLIRRALKNNDIVYMRGADPGGEGRDAGGHAWLCIGYQNDDTTMYYMNWGWGGSDNGFFNVSGNQLVTTSYTFSDQQGIINGLVPPEDSNIHHAHVAIDRVDSPVTLQAAYPNPTSDYVTVPFATDRPGELQVYSIDGRQMTSMHLSAGSGEAHISTASMPAGIYIYRLHNATGKFVVQR